MSFKEDLERIFAETGLSHLACYAERFELLTELLLETNAHTNLTAITDPREIILKHYADCLLSEEKIPYKATLLDVGCGGGFPTLPLAIVRDDLEITALDATEKKLRFVRMCAEKLDLHVKTLAGRAEDLARNDAYRAHFDVVTARAVADLPVLCEWCIPFVKKNGVFLAMKGAGGEEELEKAMNAVKTLGCEVSELQRFTLGNAKRCNILFRKTRPTPDIYPRRNGIILKKPL